MQVRVEQSTEIKPLSTEGIMDFCCVEPLEVGLKTTWASSEH